MNKKITSHKKSLEDLKWRSAIKKYNPDKKLTEEQVRLLVETARLAPTSYGLQPLKLYVVSDPTVKAKLQGYGFGQPQFVDASHIFVLAARETVTQNDISEFLQRIVDQRSVSLESLEGLQHMIQGKFEGSSSQELFTWASKQAYILLGMMLAVAADNSIDTTPMEGFMPAKFDEVLETKKDGYKSVVVLAAGFRAEDDPYTDLPKVRKTASSFVKFI